MELRYSLKAALKPLANELEGINVLSLEVPGWNLMGGYKKKMARRKGFETLRVSPSVASKIHALPSATAPFAGGSLWQSAFDPLAEPVWMMDEDCLIQRCNRAAQILFGDKIVGRHCWEVAHGTKQRIPECPFTSMCQSQHSESADLLIGGRWYSCRVDPLFDGSGKIAGSLHVLWDVTERRHAETQLREAKEILEQCTAKRTVESQEADKSLLQRAAQIRLLIEHAPVAIAMFDRQMHYLAASRRWLDDYGLTGRNIIGYSHYEVFPEISERRKSIHQRALAGETLHEAEDRFERADGSVQWVRWEIQPWFDAGGGVGGVVLFTADITARKRAEDEVRANRAMLDAALASTTDAVFVSDAEGRFVEFNEAFATFHRFNNKQECARHVADYPAILDVFMAGGEPAPMEQWAVSRALRGETGANMEYFLRRKDTGESWVGSYSFSPICNTLGAIVGAIVSARDITAQKRTESALRESEARLKLAQASAGAGIWDWDISSGKVEWSDELFKLFGLDPGKTSASFDSWRSVLYPADRKIAEERVEEAVRKGTPLDSEYRIQVPSGAVRWIRTLGKTVCGGDNKPVRMSGICLDITTRKGAEAALYEASKFNQQIISDAKEGIIVYGPDLKYRVWNRFMEEMTGLSADQVLGRHPFDVLPFLRRTGVIKSVAKVLAGKEVPSQEFPFPLQKSGRIGWALDSNSPLRSADGEIIGVIGTVRDITARKHAEELLQQANRTLQAIRDCHEAMLRAETESGLLNAVCHIIVHSGGGRLAWVGYAQNDAARSVRVVATAGPKTYLMQGRITWADEPRGRRPVGTAIRTGEVCICRNTQADPNFVPWRRAARRQGIGSVIALPLIVDNHCLGALSIYAPATDAFDAAEQLLLTDLASDLAFGITALRLRAERERLQDEVFKSIEREQERIGRDLHDGLCQLLVGARFRCGYLKGTSKARLSAVKQEAKTLDGILKRAVAQARGMAHGLNPVEAAPTGLHSAVEKLARDASTAKGPRCVFKSTGPVRMDNHHTAKHLYRIAQEAVQNAVKHAHARKVTVALARKGGKVVLSVSDDGVGIPVRLKRSGMGLGNMRMRASLVGGRLVISRRKHGGTAIRCECPVNAPDQYYDHQQR